MSAARVPDIVVAGKTSMAVAGARALRAAADERGWHTPIRVVPNRNDDGQDGWQPSLRRFAETTTGFEIAEFDSIYQMPGLTFFSLECDRLVRTRRTTSTKLYNIHFSLLPAYKGMSTSIWPILDGRLESGVTLHRILHGIDTGPIIAQRRFEIGPDDTARDLYFRCLENGTALFESMVESLLEGDLPETPQPAVGSSYHAAGEIDYARPLETFALTADQLRTRIRAFTFPEYQTVEIDGLLVERSSISSALSQSSPGTIVERAAQRRIVATIDYDLLVEGRERQEGATAS